MPPAHIVLGLVAAALTGLLVADIIQQRRPVKVSASPINRSRKEEEGCDSGDASGVNVREGDSKIYHRGEHNREKNSEKNEFEAREYSYEVRKLHELFPAATLDTCKQVFESNTGNMDKCIDFLLKHNDNLENARNSIPPVSKDTTAEKMPEMMQTDSKTVDVATPPEVGLKGNFSREELLSELSYLNALEQEIERKKTALREEELALQALQTRVEGLKSVDVGSSTLKPVHDGQDPTVQVPKCEGAASKIADAGSAQGAHFVAQDALSIILPLPETLAPELPIAELSMSDAAVSRAISEQSDTTSSASSYSEHTNDSHSQADDPDFDHRSESSWSDLGAGSVGASEH